MKMTQMKNKLMILGLTSTTFLSACSNEFSFNEVFEACEPPKSSARYGKNMGPVITSPSAGTPSQGIMDVSGTCADGFPLRVFGSGIESEVNTSCVGGAFSVQVTLKGGDGKKQIDVSQPTYSTGSIMDRLCFSKDTVPPKVLIAGTSGAQAVNTTTVTIEGTCESGLDVIVSGPQLINDVTTNCSRGRFEAEITFTGPDGLKDVVARQVDEAGNNGNDDEQYMTDMTAPVVTITSPSPMWLTQGPLNITGTCESGARVLIQGSINGAAAADCVGGTFATSLVLSGSDGIKNIVASQSDVAGNVGSANRDFVKDATPPAIRITGPAVNTITRNTIDVVGTCETGLNVLLNGAGVSAPVNTACAAGAFSGRVTLSSPDGVKNVVANQRDGAGNSGSDNRNFMRDADAPVITITAPAANSAWPTGITLQGDCETGLTVNISGSGVNAPSTANCVNSRYSSNVTFSNGDGNKDVSVAQTDGAGNTGSASRRFIRDSSAPDIRITSPADGAYVQATATLNGTCETGINVVLSGAGLSAGATIPCVAGAFSTLVTFSNGEGNKVVLASQTDGVGNVASDTKTYIKDTRAPVVTITAPAADSTHVASLTLTGACETGLNVTINGAGVNGTVNANCVASSYSAVVPLSAGDGVKNVVASQTDAAGNSGSANRNFNRDSSAPAIQITGPAVGYSAQTGVLLTGNCETGLIVNISGAGVNAPSTTNCAAGTFSTNITYSAGDGVKNVVAAQTDAGGNTASDNRNFNRDTVAPVIAFTTPLANAYVPASGTINGTCESGLTVNLTGAGLSAPVNTNCVGGVFSVAVTYSNGDGNKIVNGAQTDAAGNTGNATRTYIRDGTAPVIAIQNPAANTIAATGLTVSGTCETGLTVNISGAGVNAASTANCVGGNFSSAITFSAGDGAKVVQVAQTDAAGNTGSDSRSFQRDSSAPNLAINSPAANTRAQTGLTVGGTCETGFNVLLNGTGVQTPVSTACVAGAFSAAIVFSAGEGNKVVTANQTDAVGNTATDSRTFIRDNTAPVVAITAPAANSYVSTTATISGTCEVGGSAVVLAGAGVSASVNAACAAGSFSAVVSFTAGDGNKNVTATQTDSAGNSGSDNRTFISDSTAPVVSITAPAAGTVAVNGLTVSGTCETGLNVTLNGAGVSAAVNTACAGGAFSAAILFSNGDGNKVVTASQTDAAGNTGSDSETFVRDGTGPAVTITAPAANTPAQTGLTVSGTCETGLNVLLNGAGVLTPVNTACAAGAFSAAILFSAGEGNKVVTASQTDGAGNTGSSSRTFVRDNTAPVVAITSPAANSYVSASATITGTCENGGSAVVLSGAGVSAAVNTPCVAGSFSGLVNFSAGDGAKVVVAAQNDVAGNTGSDTRTFNRDSTAPAVVITSPAAGTIGINGLTVGGTCETGLNVTLNGAGVSAAVNTPCAAGAFSAAILFSNGDGNKIVTASQTDAAGNTGSNSRTFVRDTGAPVVSINAPAANTRAQTGLTVSGNCETGLDVLLNGAGVQTPVTVACVGGNYSAAVTFTAGEGNKLVQANQTDGVGNTGTANRTFIRDNTAPVVAITSPAANSYVSASATIAGTCENGGSNVVISGAGISSPVNAACNAGNFSGLVSFTAGDGVKVVVASQNDAAGNTGSDSRSFNLDATAPAVAITAPATATIAIGGLTVSGTCETGLNVTLNGAGVSAAVNTACVGGAFSAAILFSNGDGNKVVTASQTDAAGNTGSNSRTFVRDATAPAIAITAPAANTVALNGLTVSGTCETGLNVTLNGAGVSAAVNTACAGGAFSAAILFSNGDGNKVVTASQTDAAGNTGSNSRTFVRDTTAPVIAITAPAAGTAGASGLTVSGTCESGLTVNMSGDITATTTACAGGAFSVAVSFTAGVGNKVVTASQTDAVGNTGSSSRTFQRLNNAGNEVFTSRGPGGMVDILFVDDNSASMDAEQIALGTRFSSFTSALTGVDWQVGITTTDCTVGSPYNICGSMLSMAGRGAEYVLTALTPNYLTVFQNTIQRPETLNCLIRGDCPSGREEGLRATISAMNKRNAENAGFFRNGSDFAVVYLTDEDEQSNAPATATRPQQVVDSFRAIWGTTKKFSAHSIIVRPGDAACLASQRSQPGGNAFYATYPSQLSALTGGLSVSICEPDYSVTLAQIGDNVTRLSKSFDLLQTPILGTVSITFTPAFATTFTVSGNRVTLDTVPPAGTQIEISYDF